MKGEEQLVLKEVKRDSSAWFAAEAGTGHSLR